MDFSRRMRSSNLQCFASKMLPVYEEEEEEDCTSFHGYGRMRNSIFTFHSSVAQCTTLRYCKL